MHTVAADRVNHVLNAVKKLLHKHAFICHAKHVNASIDFVESGLRFV